MLDRVVVNADLLVVKSSLDVPLAMSYTVGFLIEPASTDGAAAFEYFDELIDASNNGEKPHPTFVKIHAELTARFPCICDLPDNKVDDGVWSDGPLINNFGERQAVVGFMFSTADSVLPFVIEVANRHDVTVFDWQTETVHRPGDMALIVEGEEDLRNPSHEQLDAAIGRLTPDGGPGFAILENVRGYIQTAGGDDLFTVEWRQSCGNGFRHFVAGKDGDDVTEVAIPTNGYQVTVRKNECLSMQDVELLFQAFLTGGDRPTIFNWRDVTCRFA